MSRVDSDAIIASPTSLKKREEAATGLSRYWAELVGLPEPDVDFRKSMRTKVMTWEPEEMIEACTVIAQEPGVLNHEYLALIKHRQDCGAVWSGKKQHAARSAGDG